MLKEGRKPVLLGEKFVLVDLAATTFGNITSTILPLIWNYHL